MMGHKRFDRRGFMKLAGGMGMGVAMTPWLSEAFADGSGVGAPPRPQAGGSANGPLVVQLIASGGWDPTLVCDPKGNALNQAFGEGDILTAGNINYAPIPGATEFWDTHYQKTLVLNGVDMKTNSHAAGQRYMASGRLGEGFPSISAVAAGFAAPELPMSYLSFGGYDRTAGLVAPTRNLDSNRLAELAHPDRTNGANENSETYHADAVQTVIRHARQNRAEAQLAKQRLPRYDASMDSMLTARMGADQLQLLEEVLPTPNGNGDFRRIELLVAAYKAGICVAGNLSRGGFDTHDDHDNRHIPRLTEVYGMLNFLWEEAERQGVADSLIVVVGSDFGRTPNYNADNGKDHWSISSMMVMGAGVEGNRVLGATDEGHNSLALDPETLEVAADDAEVTAKISPDHVHANVRRLLGIDGSDIDEQFFLPVDHELNLL
ncbi:MAG: DUF1501 domain-containing protein [Nannocystales bacterium]